MIHRPQRLRGSSYSRSAPPPFGGCLHENGETRCIICPDMCRREAPREAAANWISFISFLRHNKNTNAISRRRRHLDTSPHAHFNSFIAFFFIHPARFLSLAPVIGGVSVQAISIYGLAWVSSNYILTATSYERVGAVRDVADLGHTIT